MVALEAFSELLEVLYSAPLQEERWQHFLTLLSSHTQSGFSAFLCADSRLGLSIRAHGGTTFSQSDILTYNQRYAGSDPFRGPILRNPRTGILQGDDLLPNEGLLRTDMYRDLLAPWSCRYATLMVLTLTVRRIECVTLWRSAAHGPMDEDCNHLIQLLFPHIQQALEIRQVLGIAQQRVAGAEAMADASATATFLLNRHGRVLYRNAAAQSLLQQVDTLALHDECLVTVESRSRDSFRKLLYAAALPISPGWTAKPAHALSLPRASDKQPLQLLASPLPPAHRSRCNADLILLVTDPEKPINFPDEVLRALYGLTPAQTEVANGLLTGYSLEEIASLRKVSVSTVRQQIKNILSKTGTSRQSDLVRLLMTLPEMASANSGSA